MSKNRLKMVTHRRHGGLYVVLLGTEGAQQAARRLWTEYEGVDLQGNGVVLVRVLPGPSTLLVEKASDYWERYIDCPHYVEEG